MKRVGKGRAACARTKTFWREYLAQARPVGTGIPEIDRLYRRSLVVFRLVKHRTELDLLPEQVD
jgi:hypothetical protein